MRHVTHITVNGCNILGLLEIFGFIGFIVLSLPWLEDVHPIVRSSLALAVVLGIAAFDLVWRWLQDVDEEDIPISGRRRAFSPHLGGSILFVPVWLLLGMMPVILAVAVTFFPPQGRR